MTEKEIRKKRENLRTSIREMSRCLTEQPQLIDKIRKKVKLYNELAEELKKRGCTVRILKPYLSVQYWEGDNYKKYVNHNEHVIENIHTIQSPPATDWKKVEEEFEKKSIHNYIITLAWSETDTQKPSIDAIDTIKNYFKSLKMKELDSDFSDIGNRTEYMVKYEYTGKDSSFEVIKKSAEFMLNTISRTDFDKFNIAIFGKRAD